MSEPKFTPGEWVVSVEGGDEWWFGKGMEAVIKSGNQVVCVYSGDTDEELANAALIAAAPDLYAALSYLLQEVVGDVQALACVDERIITSAQAALAKAEGKR